MNLQVANVITYNHIYYALVTNRRLVLFKQLICSFHFKRSLNFKLLLVFFVYNCLLLLEVDLNETKNQFLYETSESYHIMNMDLYEERVVSKEILPEEYSPFLQGKLARNIELLVPRISC